MAAPSSRRWLRFSLRALLVVITLFCCWLGWEVSTVRHRQKLLKQAKEEGVILRYETTREYLTFWHSGPQSPIPPSRISLIRQWLGDEAIQTITIGSWSPAENADEKLKRLRAAFPEANLEEIFFPTLPIRPPRE